MDTERVIANLDHWIAILSGIQPDRSTMSNEASSDEFGEGTGGLFGGPPVQQDPPNPVHIRNSETGRCVQCGIKMGEGDRGRTCPAASAANDLHLPERPCVLSATQSHDPHPWPHRVTGDRPPFVKPEWWCDGAGIEQDGLEAHAGVIKSLMAPPTLEELIEKKETVGKEWADVLVASSSDETWDPDSLAPWFDGAVEVGYRVGLDEGALDRRAGLTSHFGVIEVPGIKVTSDVDPVLKQALAEAVRMAPAEWGGEEVVKAAERFATFLRGGSSDA